MSFNYEFGTQREPPGTQFDPEPPVRCPFDLNFNILEDDDESALSSLESSQLEVPTQYQEVNDDSVVATADARPTIAMPFDYSWVDWNASPLRGYKRLQRHKRTHAWWWRFGVPLVGEKFNNKKQVIEEVDSRFAIDVYSCPAMSSEAERAFSMAGCVGGSKRRRLNEETSEALLYLNHWGNSGLVSVGVHQNDELRGTEVAEFEAEDGPSPEPESDDMWYDGSSE